MGKKEIKVICVKTGSKYNNDYVYKLRSMIKRNVDLPFSFVCYTDSKINGIKCNTTDKEGWWGKVDIFKEKGPCLFIDLDTIIVDDINSLVEGIFKLKQNDILMIKPWKREGWASGIMGWSGDFSFITDDFNYYTDIEEYRWDQRYIYHTLMKHSKNIISIQSLINICSFKHHCRMIRNVPKGCRIVCFHGRPNPHELRGLKWIRQHWK